MDTRRTIVKADYIVPLDEAYIRARLRPTVAVSTITAASTALAYAASNLGNIVVLAADTAATNGIVLPAASVVTAYWGAVPGDVFTSTVMNMGTVAADFTINTTLGMSTNQQHATSIATGVSATFVYSVGGTIAIPTAQVYVL